MSALEPSRGKTRRFLPLLLGSRRYEGLDDTLFTLSTIDLSNLLFSQSKRKIVRKRRKKDTRSMTLLNLLCLYSLCWGDRSFSTVAFFTVRVHHTRRRLRVGCTRTQILKWMSPPEKPRVRTHIIKCGCLPRESFSSSHPGLLSPFRSPNPPLPSTDKVNVMTKILVRFLAMSKLGIFSSKTLIEVRWLFL